MESYFNKKKRAFSLVEILVAMSIFMVVMVVATSVLMNVVFVNKKTQAMQITMNSLYFSLDSMIREIRTGRNYHCGDTGYLDLPQNCTEAKNLISFRPFGAPRGHYVAYYFSNSAGYGSIWRKEIDKFGQEISNLQITPEEVDIEKFSVYVRGARENDTQQPFVNISVKGSVGGRQTTTESLFGNEKKIKSSFLIQMTATQRLLDI